MNVDVAIVIATYNRPDFVRACLEHLGRQTVAPRRVVVVDASPDLRTREVVRAFPKVEYRRNEKGRGSTATSRALGLEGLDEDIVAFVDDDAFPEPTWLEQLIQPYVDRDVAAVGGRALNGQPDEATEGIGEIGLLLPDGRLTGWFAADPGRNVDVDHMLGANMSVRLSAVRVLGGIRDFYPGTCLREETDIALRMRRAGMRIVYTPTAVVRHVEGEYAKGRRFDARYRYYGARNHVVLLATTLGWRDPHVRRYARTAASRSWREVKGGVRAMLSRRGLRDRVKGLAGGIRRGGVDAVGTLAGVLAAANATRRIAKGENGVG
jgi:GT2 family glycosyltransferase